VIRQENVICKIFEHGKSETRFIEEKKNFEPEDIGPNIHCT
jgi:hypothetical protein